VKYFFDTEFQDDGDTIDLISIGIVSENRREFYAVSTEARLHRCEPWLREHVLPQLPPYSDPSWMTRAQIKEGIMRFIGDDRMPQFYAYYADYDWVAFCHLFGKMIDLPHFFPKFCMDLKQISEMVGSPTHPKQAKGEHNALDDARWNRDLHDFLMKHVKKKIDSRCLALRVLDESMHVTNCSCKV